MTNVTMTPEKKRIRRALISAAVSTLENQGWTVTGVKGGGRKGRVRRITKGGKSLQAVIRTTQDTWIAFPRTKDDSKWVTLSDADVVVASSVDDPANPQFALVHILPAEEMRDRFDRAYAARLAAGHTIPVGRGVWVALYEEEGTSPIQRVGAGAGIAHPAVGRVSLNAPAPSAAAAPAAQISADDQDFEPLTIAQAKTRLARTLGVDPSSIRITVEA